MGYLQYCTGCKRTLSNTECCKCRKILLYALILFVLSGGISYIGKPEQQYYSMPLNIIGAISFLVMIYYICCVQRKDILVDQYDNYYLRDA